MLNGLPSDPPAAAQSLRDQLGEIAQRLAYVAAREGTLAPAKATRRYDGYAHYQIPRIRGTVLLHQLRLRLGNDRFLAAMRRVHERYREKPMTTAQFTAAVRESSGDGVSALVAQWVERDDVPAIRSAVASRQAGDVWETTLEVTQEGRPMAFRTTVAVEAGKQTRLHLVEVRGARETCRFSSKEKPSGVVFNWGNDVPTAGTPPYTHASLFDDFKQCMPHVEVRERAFVGTELILLCLLAGLEVIHMWGGTAGSWGRRPLDLDEYEIMLVARKPS